MKNLKRVLTFSLATALVMGTALSSVGCQTKKAPTATASTDTYSTAKPLTLTVFSQTANFTGTQGGWYAKILKNKFNITLKIISGQGEGANLYTTRSASGNLGDIVIFGSNIQNFTDSIKAGLLADMTPLLKTDGKYIAKTYAKAVTRMKNSYGKGKYVYGLPNGVSTEKATTASEGSDLTYGNYMIWSAYKKAGSPKINTLEDLLSAAQKMQKARPVADNGKKTYGFSLFKDWDGNCMCTALQYGYLYGYQEWGFTPVNANGKYEKVTDKTSQYYRSLKLYHNANKLGLLDPDSYAQTQSDFSTKLQNGQVLTNWWQWACQPQYNTIARTKNSSKVASTGVTGADGYVLIPVKNEKIFSNGFSPTGVNYEIALGSKCADKKRAMAMINWMYSPEGVEIGNDGPKGVTWTVNSKGKNPTLTTLGKKAVNDSATMMPSSAGGGTWQDGQDKMLDFKCVAENTTDPNFGQPYIYTRWTSYTTKPTDLQKTWTKVIGGGAASTHAYLTKNKQIVVAPGTAIQTPVLSTILTTKQANCAAIVKKYSWQMVMTKSDSEFNSDYAAMLKETKAAGIDAVNTAYIAQIKKLNTARAAALK